MSTSGFRINAPPESAEKRQLRLARERELLEIGRADIRAGRSISGAQLDERLERFANGNALKPPIDPAK